jgi:hypothetical protein
MNETVEDQAQHAAPVDPVFPRFFRDGEEPEQKLLGLIAYGLYEEARREWVDDFRGREGRYPGPSELRAYESSWTSSRLEGLRNAAVEILARYAGSIARDVEGQALRQALRGSFRRSVTRWLFSAILFGAAVLGAMVALSRAGIDVIDAAQTLLRPQRRAESAQSPADAPLPQPTTSAPEPRGAPAPAGSGAPVTPAPRSGR